MSKDYRSVINIDEHEAAFWMLFFELDCLLTWIDWISLEADP